ncbi:MAG: hypothetical protein P4L84_08810 [Isosphaeraceae bacterium]|nr:hypothetical protein [Isosphaeraceae bacterium]
MEPMLDARVARLERSLRRARWGALACLLLAVAAWAGTRAVEAQALKVHRGAVEPRPRTEFGQIEAGYAQMAQVMGEWEAKGWETFEIVPIQAANLGVGGPMRVAIVFRRPAK